jgi:hypothetical protein
VSRPSDAARWNVALAAESSAADVDAVEPCMLPSPFVPRCLLQMKQRDTVCHKKTTRAVSVEFHQ